MTEVRPFGTCAEPTTRTWKPFKLKHYSCIWAPSKALRFVPSLWTLGRCPRLRWKVSNVRHWAKCVFAGDMHSGKALFSECCEYQALADSSSHLLSDLHVWGQLRRWVWILYRWICQTNWQFGSPGPQKPLVITWMFGGKRYGTMWLWLRARLWNISTWFGVNPYTSTQMAPNTLH